MPIQTTYTFDTPANFTYDSTVIQIAGGKASLIDRRLPNADFFASLTASLNADWAGPAGTAIGSGAISGGRLNGDSTSAKGAKWSYTGLAQTGCFRFTVVPQYSGNPAQARPWFVARLGSGVVSNLIEVFHANNGDLRCHMWDDNGSLFVTLVSAGFAPVSGTAYEIEVDFDFNGGTHRLFLNGNVVATVTGHTETHNHVAEVALGTEYDDSTGGKALYSNLILFSTVQHTANYTPQAAPAVTAFSTANPTIQPNSVITCDAISAFAATVHIAGSDGVGFQLQVGSQKKWFNGSAWVDSDGSYAQSNPAATVVAQLASFSALIAAGSSVALVAVLHSNDGSTSPDIVSASVSYDFFGPAPTPGPTYCRAWAYMYDVSGAPIVGAAVKAVISKPTAAGGDIVMPKGVVVTTEASGYFALDMTQGLIVAFSITLPGGKPISMGNVTIPAQASVNLTTILSFS